MAETASSRLMRELQNLQENPPEGVSCELEDPNKVLKWTAVISGLKDCLFHGGKFKVSMEFSDDYPTRPPKVKFVSEVFHPNVHLQFGQNCRWNKELFINNPKQYEERVKACVERSLQNP